MINLIGRLQVRISDIDIGIANELITTAKDRIKLRVGTKEFPTELESICVEVVTAMYRKQEMQHEGMESESVDVFSVKFVNDLLKQYDNEFQAFRNMKNDEEDASRGVVRFL